MLVPSTTNIAASGLLTSGYTPFSVEIVNSSSGVLGVANAALDHSKQAREDQQTLADRLASFTPEPKNWAYSMEVVSGSDEIAPALVFDDGRFTYFSFPPNRDIPAIFYLSPVGEETRLNVHMEKEFAVVERMGRRFVLRLGQAVVGVWNDAYERDGVPPANGVTVSGVSRLLR